MSKISGKVNHLAIIMDGNGRWAQARGLERTAGHRAGADNVLEIMKAAKEFNIKYLTLYAFSTENWKRPAAEVGALMKLLQETVYRNKSVQVNDPSSVSLYLKSMIERCDGVYVKSDLSQDDLEELKSILSAALVKVEAIKLTENSCSAKKTYFESLKPIIKSINISDFEDKDYDLYFALFTQIQSLNRLIDTNIKILS